MGTPVRATICKSGRHARVMRRGISSAKSTNNPANPSQPPQPVTYGEQTTTEMAMGIFEVTCDKLGDLLFLIGDDARHRKVIERALRRSR